MVQIKSDSKTIETTLARMVEIIRECGGIIHDQLVIRVESGQISLEAPFAVDKQEPLISVPHTLLLPSDESVLRLDGDTIVIDSFSPEATPERRELLQLDLDLFNQCGKIAWQRKCTPWLYYLDAPGLYERVVEGRRPKAGFDFMKGVESESRDDLLLKEAQAAGFDVRSAEPDFTLEPGEIRAVSTGLVMELPPGLECQVRPRSGLAARFGITLPNAPGTIDPDYRGELKVLLQNGGKGSVLLKRGERIAQLVFARFEAPTILEANELTETERGEGGFGSTGVG